MSIYDLKVELKQIKIDLGMQPVEVNSCLNKNGGWQFARSIKESVKNSDAIVILSDWEDFYKLDLKSLINIMRHPSGYLIQEIQ